MKPIDIKGQRFGMLIVINKTNEKDKDRRTLWLLKCDCGREIKSSASKLLSGYLKSCGCLRDKHGEYRTRLYQIWADMKTRCACKTNVNYHHYGGRGIKVCEEWLRYPAFKEWALANGYNDRLTIDRRANDGNYSPDNCRWVTVKNNNRNRSAVKLSEADVLNIKQMLHHDHMAIAEVSRIYGMSRTIISDIKNNKKWKDVCHEPTQASAGI